MFQDSFKYYKAKNQPPDLKNVIDIDRVDEDGLDCRLKSFPVSFALTANYPGLISPKLWRVFELVDRPGLIIVNNPFTKHAQRYWMTRSLCDYPKHPNHTNLLESVKEKYSYFDSNESSEGFDWWSIGQTIEEPQEKRKFLKLLRWTTLGYHYDWTNKVYDEAQRNEFSPDLASLCRYFAEVLGFRQFRPEAAIVNYYPVGSTLAGHTDHSEKNLEAPLFSFSFGQPAIFLIGGPSKAERPDALLLRSGDVVVMTHASRLCYHAVPRVFPCTQSAQQRWSPGSDGTAGEEHPEGQSTTICCTPISTTVWNDCRETGSPHHWSAFADYISNSRININIRQVLNEGENHL
ncbi:nucleic acid dioxygenase ALKBH1 [Toxorhynchites rutilus septentrionalis]|uniref:nucleic acid dioxygenase ALKBH1 n=1 Tax=Toxorhynchites rutilus septentrionalis TaxID=329112 RepID=UPI0024798239|nr:nucleic acid dioxygenase ALKBH1 [Toxorhynchites rutilus septentrionalis]